MLQVAIGCKLVVGRIKAADAHHATRNSGEAGARMAKLNTFEDLDCWQAARAFRVEVSALCKTLPKQEDYRLKDQLVRASRSVPANIAEGFGRQHPQENLQFCRQARGSHMEVLEHLNCAADEEYLPPDKYQGMRASWDSVRGLLGGYISYLEKLCPKDKRFLK
jgi:four helix bundle protein